MLLLFILATASAPVDACEIAIPAVVHRILHHQYPNFRIARTTDYDSETLKIERPYHGGSDCIAVAAADYDGNGRQDFAFLITNPRGRTYLLVARNLSSEFAS